MFHSSELKQTNEQVRLIGAKTPLNGEHTNDFWGDSTTTANVEKRFSKLEKCSLPRDFASWMRENIAQKVEKSTLKDITILNGCF